MSRLAAAIEALALALLTGLALGLIDGWRASPLPGEGALERLRSTVALDLALLALPGLILAFVALFRPVPPRGRTALAAAWLATVGVGFARGLPGLAAGGEAVEALRLHQPLPLLRLPDGEESAPIVLISIDTLRADARLPLVEARTAGALRLRSARANAPWTLPSMASVMTGRSPAEHGAGRRIDPTKTGLRTGVSSEVPTLAERLAEAGYVNAAVLTNAYLDPQHGMTRGFDRAFDLTRRSLLLRGLRRSMLLAPLFSPATDDARAVTDRAVDVLSRLEAGRFFLWIHYIDPHAPYRRGGDPTAACALPDCFDGWAAMRRGEHNPSAEEMAQARALYAEEVSRLDGELERLFSAFDAVKLWDRALVILLSDHGEALGEHGGGEHGHSFFEEVVRVPLYAWAPGRSGADVKHDVSLSDTFEAVLRWSGDGTLGPLEPDAPARPVAMASILFGEEGAACVRDGYKLIGRGESLSLYNLTVDPGETRDISAIEPARIDAMRGCLPPPLEPATGPAPADPLGALRALGYIE